MDSEVIFYARVQALIGILAAGITFLDPALVAPILPPEYLPWFLLANGLATEILRRLRTKKSEFPEEGN